MNNRIAYVNEICITVFRNICITYFKISALRISKYLHYVFPNIYVKNIFSSLHVNNFPSADNKIK